MVVIYQPEQVRRAAKFLAKRNPAFADRTARDVEKLIMDRLREHVRDVKKHLKRGTDWRFMASGGYWILAFLSDDQSIEVDVLVDAAIGRDSYHTYLEV